MELFSASFVELSLEAFDMGFGLKVKIPWTGKASKIRFFFFKYISKVLLLCRENYTWIPSELILIDVVFPVDLHFLEFLKLMSNDYNEIGLLVSLRTSAALRFSFMSSG